MKKPEFLKLIALTLFMGLFRIGYTQTAEGYAKKILSILPTIAQIDNSKLPAKSKQLLAETRSTLTDLSVGKTQFNKQLIKKLDSLTKAIDQNIVTVMAQKTKTGGSPEQRAACQDMKWACFAGCQNKPPEESQACDMQCIDKYFDCVRGIISSSLRTDIGTSGPGTATQNK